MADNKEDNKIKILKERILLYFQNGVKVHASISNNLFFNGKILTVNDSYFLIDDILAGCVPVAYNELHRVAPVKKLEDNNGNKE